MGNSGVHVRCELWKDLERSLFSLLEVLSSDCVASHFEILIHSELREGTLCLRKIGYAKPSDLVWRKIRNDLSIKSDMALVDVGEARDCLEKRAFSRPIRAHYDRYLVRLSLQ